ncbi:MAG: hypothetical protein HY305_03795 [Sphingobacteriales bacterium]|nr:hypothetical protein [Sphingobacteriales bacterium]
MCAYHTWFYSDKVGYVIECLDNNIQLGFGTVMVTFEMADFDMFVQYIRNKTEERMPLSDRHVKSIMLKTTCKGISLLLTEVELYNRNEMIDYVDTEMKSTAIMKLFN